MTSIKDFAKDFVPKQTMNIADLPEITVDTPILDDGKGQDKNGKEFTYKYIIKDEIEYRVPDSVISQLKDQMEANPNLVKFKVKKTGDGMLTKYTVLPIVA
jgi:hypothetical protein